MTDIWILRNEKSRSMLVRAEAIVRLHADEQEVCASQAGSDGLVVLVNTKDRPERSVLPRHFHLDRVCRTNG
ncbi:hypothetical protein [Streptomyces sp. NPDC060194]|uniref:hypothetical protein n=1 Tax=Streptomyces sp. NPDC060194 TaxID=3347069 RepID=UPI00365A3AF2